jgi:hypothetical protein
MKNVFCVVAIAAVCVLMVAGCRTTSDPVSVAPQATPAVGNCVTIQNGVVMYSAGHYLAGQPLMTGFDPFGYNYQGMKFKGSYANAYLGRDGYPPYDGDDDAYLAANPGAESTWYWPYRDTFLMMKWNDAWLSNEDCDSDGELDRHYGYPGYQGSGAWLTNHMKGSYVVTAKKGMKLCKWTYFVKIVAAPDDATLNSGVWYNAGGVEIGAEIWGDFATVQEVSNDPCAGENGVLYHSPAGPGFGKY